MHGNGYRRAAQQDMMAGGAGGVVLCACCICAGALSSLSTYGTLLHPAHELQHSTAAAAALVLLPQYDCWQQHETSPCRTWPHGVHIVKHLLFQDIDSCNPYLNIVLRAVLGMWVVSHTNCRDRCRSHTAAM